MLHRSLKQFCGLAAATALAFGLVSCNGNTGSAGANGGSGATGATGGNGPAGSAGPTGPGGTVAINAAGLSASEWAGLALNATITSATVTTTPVVNFTVTNAVGTPVAGLNPASDFGFAISKLVPGANGSPNRWICYNVVTPTKAVYFPNVEKSGSLVDHHDGSYTYTFALDLTQAQTLANAATLTSNQKLADLDDLSFQPTLPHRVFMTVGGKYAGTGAQVLTSGNAAYDFLPSTGAPVASGRDMISTADCNTCHTKLSMHADHFPAVHEVKLCVVCHTEQHKFGSGESLPASGNVLVPAGFYGTTMRMQDMALPNFPNMVHHIHMGEGLYYQGYNQFFKYNEVAYPQDQRNCVKCHKATTPTPQGDNWMNNPSRLACGACHDNIVWSTGANHGTATNGGAQADDKNCTGCHTPAGIKTLHASNDLTALNTSTPTGLGNFTYDIQSMTLNASMQPVIKFRISLNGTPVTTFATPTMVNHLTSGRIVVDPNFQPIPNYISGPSLTVVYGMPQDGITAPADFNVRSSASLTSLLIPAGQPGKTGSLSATADANGYWTATITGDLIGQPAAYPGWTSPVTGGKYSVLTPSPITVPTGSTMVTAGIYGTFTQIDQAQTYPYTKADVTVYPAVAATGGLLRTAMFKTVLASGITGNAARRVVVDTNKCNACHDQLGTSPNFHGGAASLAAGAVGSGPRNEATACSFCHTVNQTSSGWAANVSTYIHGIHGSSKRSLPFTWHATATSNYGSVTYPALLNNCEQCHVPGSYDFSNSTNAAALPNLLWTTVGTGTYTAGPAISPYVQVGNNYGGLFSYNVATGATTAAAATTLVSSPITAACASCHDTSTAIAHMKGNGGTFYQPRGTGATSVFATKVEQCLICHGNGKTADIRQVHSNW